jgi:hypothetical protein
MLSRSFPRPVFVHFPPSGDEAFPLFLARMYDELETRSKASARSNNKNTLAHTIIHPSISPIKIRKNSPNHIHGQIPRFVFQVNLIPIPQHATPFLFIML